MKEITVSTENNLALTKKAYADFASGETEASMDFIADDVEWIVPGRSSVSGVYHGKQEVAAYWAVLAEKSHTTTPYRFLADGDVVVVLTVHDQEGDEASDCTDILTFRDDKVVRFASTLDTASLEKVFGTK